MGILTPSQKFLVFWLFFLFGTAIGSRLSVPFHHLLWFAGLWLLLLISGQPEKVEAIALSFSALFLGILLWHLTGGETWISSQFLTPLVSKLTAFRDSLIDRIFLTLPEPHGSLLSGILLGNRVKLNADLLETFRVVGLSHLIAVSGYNLTILTANAQALFRPLIGRRAIFVSAVLIVVFVILSGAPSSILRAAVMASTLLVASYLGRPSRSVNILVFTAGLLTLFEPKILFEIGFQLSLAATYGLIRLGPLIERPLRRFRLPEWLRLIVAETLAATVLTAPILIAYFERISVVSPLSNLLVLPIMPLLMGLGIIGALLLLVLPAIGQYVVWLAWPLLHWVVFVSTRLGELNFASAEAQLSGWVTIGVLALVVVGLETTHFVMKKRGKDPVMELEPIRI